MLTCTKNPMPKQDRLFMQSRLYCPPDLDKEGDEHRFPKTAIAPARRPLPTIGRGKLIAVIRKGSPVCDGPFKSHLYPNPCRIRCHPESHRSRRLLGALRTVSNTP